MKISIKDLTKVFIDKKNIKEVYAVNNVSLDIPDGKLIGLLGPSGCGKSTMLYMLSGLLEPSDGSIFFDDEDVTNLNAYNRNVGLVFQNYSLYPHMTVLDNIIFPLLNLKYKKKDAILVANKIASICQIDNLLDRRPKELSGGQQQRVAIARALVKRPDVLLLDEPLSNLDARLRLQMREEIRRIQQETNVTTVFVTHDQEEAMSICDLICVMKDGIIQQYDEPQKIYDNPNNLFVAKFLGTPQINVFEGNILDNKLYINNDYIMDFKEGNQNVYVGIRAEGFNTERDGSFNCLVEAIEVMGRDVSIIATNPKSLNERIRAIVDSNDVIPNVGDNVKFIINPKKVLVFNKETEERIYGKEE